MARKKDEIGEEIEENIEIVDETIEELEEVEEVVEIKPVSKKSNYTVYRNEGKELFLIDDKGNGFKIPTPEQYKNVKTGDTVYI